MKRHAILFFGLYLVLFISPNALANPQGPQVVHGQAGFSNPDPNTLHVTNSPNAIINWKGFSIQHNEITRFIQQSASSAVLNRVTGPDPSHLLGQLLSNGRVFLINPHGMVFGPNCVIDTAGFVASTLNITDQDFLQGNLKFEGGSDSGSIINQGFITAGKNGDIYLIAPNIENSGIIHTEGGNLLLAAGESITITSLDLKDVHFEIQAPENEVLNLGKILADGGAVNVFAGTLKHSGEIRADTVSVDETGAIILSASKDITLEPGSRISASGTPGGVHDGGKVRIIAQDTLDFQRGAEIRVDGGPDGGDGGYLELSGKQKIALNGVFSGNAQAEGYPNGSLFIDPANINLTDSMGISGSIVVGTASREIAVSPDSSTVYVVVSGAASVVKVIDAASDTVINTISVGSFSEGIAISSDGNYLYVTNASSDNISVINTATQTVVKTLTVGDSPNNVTVRPDTNRVYVTNGLGDSVSVIDSSDPPNASVITTIPVGDNPRNIAVTPDGSKVYVSNRNDANVSVIDTGSNSVIGTINVGNNPRKIAAGPLGSDRIYVCNYLSNNVSVINTSTDTVIATPGAGGNPEGAAVSPDGSYLYVTNYSAATLTILDTGSNSVVDTLTVGGGARGIAASPDGARVYVGNSMATDVSIAQLPTDDTGGDGVILSTDSPGATFNINPVNLFGAWTDVSLAATNDITVVDPIGDSDIPVGGSLTLDAGNNVNINADIGSIVDYFEHDLFVTAGNTINVNAGIFIAIEGSGFGDPDIVFSAGQAVNFGAAGRLDVVSMDTTADVVIEALSPVGAINMAAGSNITYTGNSSPGALVSLRADDVVLDGTISSPNSGVNIETYNAARAIDLGTDTLGKLGLTNAELNNITASNISVTGLNSGEVTVSSPITLLSSDGLSILVQNLISIESGAGITVPLSLLLEGTDMDIQADLTANSKITLQTPGAGTPMEVGTSGPGPGVVALDQAELDHINVLGQLQIGQWDVPDITVTNPVSVPYQIILRSQDDIHVNASLTASEITLRPGPDAGDVVNVAADLTATAGDIDVTLGTGVVNFTGSPTITASSFSADTVNSGGGTVRFEAPLNITGDLNVTAGNVELNQGGDYGGDFNVAPGANLEFAGGTQIFSGPSDFNGSGFYILSGGSFAGAGTVTNNAIFDIMTGTSIAPAFINAGTTSGSGTVNFQGGYTQTAGHTIVMSGANLAVTGPLTLNGGILMGDGTITGNVVNNGGVVNVGFSPGTLTIDGDYTQGPGGMLLIELGGLTQGMTYDLLDISGTANLDGMLYVSLIAPFDPAPLDTFQIITCGTARLGNFAVENPPAGKTMIVNYGSFDVTLSDILDAGPSLNQWITGADGDWNVAGNWSLGIPLNSQDVEIDLGSWIITVPTSYAAEAGTLYVGVNNTLTLLEGSLLDVTTSAIIDGDLTITGGEFCVTGGDAAINGLLALQGGPNPNQFAELTANNILINGPSLQVTGGTGNDSSASVKATTGKITINVTDGITVQGGNALGADASIQGQTGQDIDALFLEVIGDVGDAFIDTNTGSQSIDTTGQNPGNIGILVEAAGTGLAAIHSDGTQAINVTNADYMKVVGSVGNADISSNSSQTITVTGTGLNAIEVGSATAAGNSLIEGNQTITAGTGAQSGSITVQAGDAGGAHARIYNSNPVSTQQITTTGDINIFGGDSPGGNISDIASEGSQNVNAGNDILVQAGGGSGGNQNSAAIVAGEGGVGDQTIIVGNNLHVIGGASSGWNNWARVGTTGGSQNITATGQLLVQGSSNGDNNLATVDADTGQDIQANDIHVIAGADGNMNEAEIECRLGGTQDIEALNELKVQGGAGGDKNEARIALENTGAAQIISAGAGGIKVLGGSNVATSFGNAAEIINDVAGATQTLNLSGGDLLVQGGNGVKNNLAAVINNGTLLTIRDSGSGSDVIVQAGGGVFSTDNDAEIKSTTGDLTIDIDGNLNLQGGTEPTAMDNNASIFSHGIMNIALGGGIDISGGGGDFAHADIRSDNDVQTTVTGDVNLTGGIGNYAEAGIQGDVLTVLNVTSGDILLTGGAGNFAETFIESDNDVQVTVTGGNVDMQAGSGDEAYANICSNGSLALVVTAGYLSATGGGGSDSSAGVTIDGGGTIDVSIGGNLTLTGGSGPDASAAIGSEGSGTPTINIDVAGNLVMSGGAGQGPAVIGSPDQSVTINIGDANPIGGNISVSGGTGANALALIGTVGGGKNADIAIETNGSLTLNAQTGGTLIGSEFAGGVVDITAGMGGSGNISLNDGVIQVDGDVALQTTAAGGTITQAVAGIIDIGTHLLNTSADGGISLLGTNTTGGIIINQTGNVILDGLNGGVSDVTVITSGTVTQTAAINSNQLIINSGGGINLTDAGNSVTSLTATDTSGLGISFVNSTSLGLGLVDAGAGIVTLKAGGAGSSLLDANGAGANIVASAVNLESPVNIGTLADPLETQAASLMLLGIHTGEVAVANTGNLAFAGGAGMSDLLLTTTGTLDLTGLVGGGSENLDMRANGFNLGGFPITGTDVKLSGGSGTLDINSTNVQGSYVELAGSQIQIRQGLAPPSQVTSTGDIYIHGGNLTVDSATVHSIADTTLQTGSVTLQANGTSNALVKADGDMTVSTGTLKVLGSTTSASLNSKLQANGNMNISAGSVTVQGGDLFNTFASIDPSNLVMNVNGDVNVLGGDGDGSYAEISADTVSITAGPALNAGNINITGGSGMDAGAWIQSFSGDVTLIAGDTMFPADINLVGGAGTNADSLIDAGGGGFDAYLTFHNGVGLTLLPGLTGDTDVGILAMNLILNSYNPFYQPPVDPINDVVSSQNQLDELLNEIMGAPDALAGTGNGTGDEEEEDEQKRGRLICR